MENGSTSMFSARMLRSEEQDSSLLACCHQSHGQSVQKTMLYAVNHMALQPVGLPIMQHVEGQDSPHRFVAIIAQILTMLEMQGTS